MKIDSNNIYQLVFIVEIGKKLQLNVQNQNLNEFINFCMFARDRYNISEINISRLSHCLKEYVKDSRVINSITVNPLFKQHKKKIKKLINYYSFTTWSCLYDESKKFVEKNMSVNSINSEILLTKETDLELINNDQNDFKDIDFKLTDSYSNNFNNLSDFVDPQKISIMLNNSLKFYEKINSKMISIITSLIINITKMQTWILLNNQRAHHNSIINNLQETNNKLCEKIEIFENEKRVQEKEEIRKAINRENHKNRNILPLRNPISYWEFIFALKRTQIKSYKKATDTEKFNAATDRIALFLLYFTGLRVLNLLEFNIQDISNIFLDPENHHTSVWLIKKPKPEYQEIIFKKEVTDKLFYGDINLMDDFKYLLSVINDTRKKKGNNLPLYSISFYSSYWHPLKKVSRQCINLWINRILKDVQNNCPSAQGKRLTSHSFRVNVITTIIKRYNYEIARRFIHHNDINTTAVYDRNTFSPKHHKVICSTLSSKNQHEMLLDKEVIIEANELSRQ